jgi:pimeloyl-ACP methyl ester carboxylesterase
MVQGTPLDGAFGRCTLPFLGMEKSSMRKRFSRAIFIFLVVPWIPLNIGCGYITKNEKHQVYSRPKYGQDRFVTVHGHNIHYVEAGKGQPILLIPGAWSTYRYWNRVMPFLSKQYRTLALDYLGVGDSDKPRSGFGYTVEEQADLIAGMMETLQISKIHIAGTSYGGGIALNLAARYSGRVGKIIVIEGNGMKHKKMPHRPMKDLLRWPLVGEIPISATRSGLLDKMIARLVMRKAWYPLSDQEKKEIVEIVSQSNKTASRVSWYHISRTLVTSKDFAEEAKTIQVPILYLYGENSDYRDMAETNAEFLKTHLPQVEVFCLKDGIHNLELQKPEKVAKFILDFLSKNQPNSLATNTSLSGY